MLPLLLTPMLAQAPAEAKTQLTVYNQGFALVKESRSLSLRQGVQAVTIEDVAQRIEANSVAIRSVSAPGSFSVLEQNYRFDLISPAAILAKAVGGTVILNRVLPNGEKERIEGTLLSSPTAVVSTGNGSQMTYNGMVIRTSNGRILLNPTGEVEVTSIPRELISKPSLVWLLDSSRAGSNQVELSYLTQGISWTSDYVLALDQAGKLGDLKGWVTLNNQCGARFEGATLKLLAGDVQRAQPQAPAAMGRAGGMRADAAAMTQEAFADYHLYTVNRPVTVENNEQKQVSLLEAQGAPVRRRLLVDAMRGYSGYRPNEGQVGSGPIKPLVQIMFTNNQASRLGMPLPAGTVKVFQRDSSGQLQMLGEDRIGHTPRDEEVTLDVGRAFDVVVERKRTAFTWLDNRRGARESFAIEIRNRKETPDQVTIWERFWGEWVISNASQSHTKLDAGTVQWVVDLKAGEVKTLTFTVETRWP